MWSEGLEASAPLAADAPSQKAWDAPCVAASLKALQTAAPDSVTQACLLAACRKEAGAWLQALPVSALGLRMEDEVFRVATGLRLGSHFVSHIHASSVGHQWIAWAPMDFTVGRAWDVIHAIQ